MKIFKPGTISTLRTLSVFLILAAVALLAYANTFEAPFVFDDLDNITQNPHIRLTKITPERIIAATKGPSPRPLANLTTALNYYFHRYDVRGYHAVNLLIHVFTALLVFLVARATLRLCGMESGIASLLAATLWLVNPVHTQSVTYIIQRMNSLSTMFYMLALFCYIQARIGATAGRSLIRRRLFYALCLMAGILGLISKQIVATLPVMIFLYEWYFFQNLNRAWLKKKLPWTGFAALTLLIVAVLYLGASPIEKILKLYEEKQNFTPAQRLLTEPAVVIYYLSLLFFPHPARLNVDYDFPLSLSPIHPAATMPALLALSALVFLAVYAARKQKLLSFALIWFLVNLAIESSFIGLALIFEHRTYLPSVFLFIAFVFFVSPHLSSRKKTISLFLCLAICCCGIWTHRRNMDWQDSTILWQDNIKKSPNNVRPYVNLGTEFVQQKKITEALVTLQKAENLDPGIAKIHYNIAKAYLEQPTPVRQIDKIKKKLERAVSIDPSYFQALSDLGALYLFLGKTDKAVQYLSETLRINPYYANAHHNMALALKSQGYPDQALEHIQQACELDPQNAKSLIIAGDILDELEKTEEAARYYKNALALSPESSAALLGLGNLYAKEGDYGKAANIYERLAGLMPNIPAVYYNLACFYAKLGQKDLAVKNLKEAIDKGYKDITHLRTDSDLENISGTEYFQNLVKTHTASENVK